MVFSTWLLFVVGCLGALDIALYHSLSHGIRSHPDSRWELVTHSLRGPTYALLFLVVPNFSLQGWWFGALAALLVLDVAISLVDFALERKSRLFFDGLPSGEYVLHSIIAMVFGAMCASIVFEGGHGFREVTMIAYVPAEVPTVLRAVFVVMAALVLASGIQDAFAVVRLSRVPDRAPDLAGHE